ncbi:MAG: hypothetical protein PHO20_04770 [Candidatus Peribacteraceae bacterium]|nr:hypothetical protein [Candidatus Peribacteraceae bacterium]MDD5740050.1 hypothetical protein [Candidatus Peribacteraceae bacterium]
MDTPRLPEENPKPLTGNAVPEPQTGIVTAAIRTLLADEKIRDEGDRRHIAEALAFMETSTQNLPDVARHASSIGEVMGGYDMQGAEPPPEIDALNRHFQTLLFRAYLGDAEMKLTQAPRDPEGGQHVLRFALDIAKTFFKGYHDDTLLHQALALQQRVGQS